MITSRDIQIIFIIFYDNNVARYNQAFKNAGYPVPNSSVQAKAYVVKKMYDLYLNSPSQLNSIMNSVGWNPNANNYTTNPDTYAKVQKFLQDNFSSTFASSKIDFNNLWGGIQGFLLGNQQTVTAQIVTTPVNTSGSTTSAVIAYSLLALATVGLVIVAVKFLR